MPEVVNTFEMLGRTYKEMDDGTIFCDRRACPGSSGLRGARTNVPICMKCAVRTPTGYISEDAAKEQADKYFNISNRDYLIAALVAFFGTFLAGLLVSIFSFGGFFGLLLIFFFSGGIGASIGEIVLRAIKHRRGRYTQRVVGIAMGLATALLVIFTFNIFIVIFGVLATGSAVSRFEVALRT